MNLSEAKQALPKFAKGLAHQGVTNVLDLRVAVQEEIASANKGENPLEPKQIKALQLWLAKVARNY